jgi:hypothetical protein
MCATSTFDGTENLVQNGYDGTGNGTNRWCITNTGDAVAGEILSGKKVWVDGLEVTGSLSTQTLSAANDTVAAGNYAATTLSVVDTDLASANIKSGVTIFGFAGNVNVVDTSSGDATTTELLLGKKAWVDGLEVTGSIATSTLSAANDTVAAGYYDATTLATVDSDLAVGNIKNGTTIFGYTGNVNVVDTSAGDATAGDLANNKIAYVDGAQITGTMFTNQKMETIDDWLNTSGTVAEYTSEEATWATSTGAPFSGYNSINYLGSAALGEDEPNALNLASGDVKTDNRTGLWWTDVTVEGTTASSTKNNFAVNTDNNRPTGGRAVNFCEALNTANFGNHND